MDESKPTKRCSRCREFKSPAEFGINRAARDGLMYHCRACVKVSIANLTPEQREAKRRRNAEFMARQRADPEKGPEISARQVEWFKDNAERAKAYRASFKARNPERVREHQARYYKQNPERFWEHVQRRRARIRGSMVGPVDMKALWSGTCGICGKVMDALLKHPDPLSPSVDHIVPLARGGSHTQDNLQWAHLACNLRKHCSLP